MNLMKSGEYVVQCTSVINEFKRTTFRITNQPDSQGRVTRSTFRTVDFLYHHGTIRTLVQKIYKITVYRCRSVFRIGRRRNEEES